MTDPSLVPLESPVRLTTARLRISRSKSRVSLATVYQVNALITERNVRERRRQAEMLRERIEALREIAMRV